MAQRDLKRLADAVYERRSEFGMTQEEFAAQCDLGVATIQRIEDAKIQPRARTLGNLDRGALWQSGSSRRTLDGGSPIPLRRTPKPLAEWTMPDAMEEAERLARETGDAAEGLRFMRRWRAAVEAAQTNTEATHDAS